MVLTGVREDQIENCLSGLSLDEIDILVKYVYKGLGKPRNNGPLFKWHAKVCVCACISHAAPPIASMPRPRHAVLFLFCYGMLPASIPRKVCIQYRSPPALHISFPPKLR